MSYHMTHWLACPYTSSLVAAIELYLGAPVSVVGLHRLSFSPLFVLTAPTKATQAKLRALVHGKAGARACYWGSWATARGGRVRAYRLLHKGETIPGSSTRGVLVRLVEADRRA